MISPTGFVHITKSLVYYKVRKNRKSLNRNLSGLGTYIILCLTKSKCQRQEDIIISCKVKFLGQEKRGIGAKSSW